MRYFTDEEEYKFIKEKKRVIMGKISVVKKHGRAFDYKGKLLKLNSGHIEYVMDCFKGNTTKVKNIKKYLLAALFNAPTTISGYYQAEVNHDFPQFARVK